MDNIEIQIAIRNPCNYHCYYCVAQGSHDSQLYIPIDLRKIESFYSTFEGFSLTSFECGSGEPLLHPQFQDLLEICIKKGLVSIPTNNSLDPQKWLPSDPRKVYIRAALHPQSELDINSFIDRLLYAREKGATITTLFVMHPKRIEKAKLYKDLFKKFDISLTLAPFTGTFNGKEYPISYTEKERELVKEANNWYQRLKMDVFCRNFKDIPCRAGRSLFYITPSGNIQRCLYDKTEIKCPFESAEPCKVDLCGCGLFLEKLHTQTSDFWASWRKLAGLSYDDSKKSSDEEIYIKNKKIYMDLMKEYNKNV